MAILDVCGFNDWLLRLLADYGYRQIVLVQPEKRDRHKTDRRDANALGELLWTSRQRLAAGKKVQNVRQIVPPSPRNAEDRQLTMFRHRLCRLAVMRRPATVLSYMLKRQQHYHLSAANDPASACATVPPDVNAFLTGEREGAVIARQLASQQESLSIRIGRNDPCPCGSGKKFKRCCVRSTVTTCWIEGNVGRSRL